MIACGHPEVKRFGRDRKGNQRFRCLVCGKTWIEQQPKPLGEMRIPLDKAVFVLKLLLEGTSINATVRLTGIAKETILDLLVMVGNRALQFWQDRMKGLSCNECQVDEVWGFVGMKEKTRVRKDRPQIFADDYACTAIDRYTKLLR